MERAALGGGTASPCWARTHSLLALLTAQNRVAHDADPINQEAEALTRRGTNPSLRFAAFHSHSVKASEVLGSDGARLCRQTCGRWSLALPQSPSQQVPKPNPCTTITPTVIQKHTICNLRITLVCYIKLCYSMYTPTVCSLLQPRRPLTWGSLSSSVVSRWWDPKTFRSRAFGASRNYGRV